MSDKELVSATIAALAAIDAELGLPEDGCNSTARTLTAIRLLHSVHRDDVAEVARLTAERAALQAKYDDIRSHWMQWCDHHALEQYEAMKVERDALLARVEAAEKDAARYRWLRNESLHRLIRGPICIDADTWGEPVMACGKHITLDGATLDAAIDAAMEGGK